MKRYDIPSVITNDLFCVAYLLSVGCSIEYLIHNRRKRISFVVIGENVEDLRDRYKAGSVLCDLRSFRANLTRVRQMMNDKRSDYAQPDNRRVIAEA